MNPATEKKIPSIGRESYRRPRRQLYTIISKELPEMTPGYIIDLRRTLQMTQTEFAKVLGVTRDAMKDWERGVCKPNTSAQRLIYLIAQDHSVINEFVTVINNKDEQSTLFPQK